MGFDFYLDFVFFVDIILTFNMPIYDQKSRLITDRKLIAIRYLRSWFLMDIIVCLPFSFIRKNSADWPNSKDDLLNFVTLNWTSIQRFYRVILLTKILRIRRIIDNITYCLKKLSFRMQA